MLVVTVTLRSVSEVGILCNTQHGSRWSFTRQYLQGCFGPFHFLKEVAVSYSTDCLRLCFVCKKCSFCWTSWNARTGAILQLMEREVWIWEEAEVVTLELRLFWFCIQAALLGVFYPVVTVPENLQPDGSISLQTPSSHLSYKDVRFYFKWWTYLITVPPTSCFVGIERKLRSVAGLNSPSQENKKKATVMPHLSLLRRHLSMTHFLQGRILTWTELNFSSWWQFPTSSSSCWAFHPQ